MKRPTHVSFTTLVCDTDFLIKISNFPAPEFQALVSKCGFELATIPSVALELKGLRNSKHQMTSKHALHTLSLIGDKISLLEDSGQSSAVEADDALIDFAKRHNDTVLVCTLDGKLLSRLEKMKVRYLTLRKDRPFMR